MKGQGKEKERDRKGKVKLITLISAVSVRFETVLKYRNNRNKPKEVLYSFGKNTETEPKLPGFRFVSVRTERKKIRFAGHPNSNIYQFTFFLVGACITTSWFLLITVTARRAFGHSWIP